MDYLSSFIGPKLDNLNFDMIDSGKSRSSLLVGHNSFSSSRGSNIDSPDIWSCSSPSPSKSGSTNKKRFPIRRRKKKTKEGAGWAFPLPACSSFPQITRNFLCETLIQRESLCETYICCEGSVSIALGGMTEANPRMRKINVLQVGPVSWHNRRGLSS